MLKQCLEVADQVYGKLKSVGICRLYEDTWCR